MYRVDNGLRWYKTALHVHTRASEDGPELEYKEYCNKLIEEGFEVIAITDHNTCEGIQPMIEATNEILDETEEKLWIIPGVELSMYEDYHMVVLFQNNATTEHVDDFLNELGLNQATDTTPNDQKKLRSEFPFTKVLKKIKIYGGVAFYAHADKSDRGILSLSHRNKMEILSDPFVKMMEVSDENIELNPSIQDEFVKINHSDFHSIEHIKDPDRATWFKMGTTPNVENIKQSIYSPATRISNQPPQKDKHIRIEQIVIDAGFLKGTDLSFNASLNCIIGTRGTGKSLIIDAMKYTLDKISNKEQNLLDRIYNTHKKNTVIELFISKGETTYKIQRKVNIGLKQSKNGVIYQVDEENSPKVYEIEGKEEIKLPDNPNNLFKIEIYSQGEVEKLKEKLEDQLSIIDSVRPLSDLKWEKQQVKLALEDNRKKIVNKYKEISSLQEKLIEKPKLNERMVELDEILDSSIFLERGSWQQSKREIDKLMNTIKSARVTKEIKEYELRELEISPEIETVTPLFEQLTDIYSEQTEKLEEKIQELNRLMKGYSEKADEVLRKFTDLYMDHDEKYMDVIKNKDDQTKDKLVEERDNLKRRIDNIKNQLQPRYDNLVGDLKDRWNQRKQQIEKLSNISSQIKQRRVENAKKLSELSGENIRIEVKSKTSYNPEYYEIVDRIADKNIKPRKEQITELIENINHLQLAKSLIEKEPIDVDTITPNTKEKIMNMKSNIESFTIDLDDLPYKRVSNELLKLQELNPHQRPMILVRSNDNWKNIRELSVGQTCSTILTLLLSAENKSPLIIDQPEDDLDPLFIKENIISKIIDPEIKRQYIFCTHNPNIPILGDAGLIIKMDAYGSEKCTISEEGCFESMTDPLLEMEGGKEALKIRAERHGFEFNQIEEFGYPTL